MNIADEKPAPTRCQNCGQVYSVSCPHCDQPCTKRRCGHCKRIAKTVKETIERSKKP